MSFFKKKSRQGLDQGTPASPQGPAGPAAPYPGAEAPPEKKSFFKKKAGGGRPPREKKQREPREKRQRKPREKKPREPRAKRQREPREKKPKKPLFGKKKQAAEPAAPGIPPVAAAAGREEAPRKKARKPLFKKKPRKGEAPAAAAAPGVTGPAAAAAGEPPAEAEGKPGKKARFARKGKGEKQPKPAKKAGGGGFGGKTSPVGLDLGRSSLTAVRLRHNTSGSALQQVALDSLPEGLVQEGEVRDVEALAYAIRDFWKTHKIRGRKVAIGLANQKIVVRSLDFPLLEDEELRSAIEFQAQDYIPIPIEEAVFDYHVLGRFTDEQGVEKQRILVVAAQKDMVMDFVNALKKAKLSIAGIDLQAFALLRSQVPRSFLDTGMAPQAVAVANIASDITNLIVDVAGEPQFTRIISFGGDDFTKAVQEHLNVPFADAEIYKVQVGLPLPAAQAVPPAGEAPTQIIRPGEEGRPGAPGAGAPWQPGPGGPGQPGVPGPGHAGGERREPGVPPEPGIPRTPESGSYGRPPQQGEPGMPGPERPGMGRGAPGEPPPGPPSRERGMGMPEEEGPRPAGGPPRGPGQPPSEQPPGEEPGMGAGTPFGTFGLEEGPPNPPQSQPGEPPQRREDISGSGSPFGPGGLEGGPSPGEPASGPGKPPEPEGPSIPKTGYTPAAGGPPETYGPGMEPEGGGRSEQDKEELARRALELTADALADEIRRSLDYYMSQEQSVPVSKLLISGGGAMLPNLEPYLSQVFPFPVELGNPLLRIAQNKSALSDEELKVLAPRLAIAIGLALEDEG